MTRNTLRRGSSCLIYDEEIKARLLEMFHHAERQSAGPSGKTAVGIYLILPTDEEPLNAQEYFYEQAYEIAENFEECPFSMSRLSESDTDIP